jgi:hypothetical protein
MRSGKKEKKRKETYLRSILSFEFKRIKFVAIHAASTIKTIVAANGIISDTTRERTIINIPPIIEDWKFMSLLSSTELEEVMNLIKEIHDHNFDMKRAGGSYGDDNFSKRVQTNADNIATKAVKLSNTIRQRSS